LATLLAGVCFSAAFTVASALSMSLSSTSDRLIYPAYATVAVGGVSALDDQAMAGVIMWAPGR
jgi:hypothetical protein